MNTGKLLKVLRENKRLSVRNMAKTIGVPLSTYKSYESGTALPARLIPNICNAFSLTPNEFFSFEKGSQENLETILQDINLLELKLKRFMNRDNHSESRFQAMNWQHNTN